MNTHIGDKNISGHTASCGKVSRKSAQGRRKICGGKNDKTLPKYNSLPLSLARNLYSSKQATSGGTFCSAELLPNYELAELICTPTLSMVLLEWYRPPVGPI